MNDALIWALDGAREQSLALVADLPQEAMGLQASPDERHPTWLLGHLLLADTYLVSLLASQPLDDDFPRLLALYGPGSAPGVRSEYDLREQLLDRLGRINIVRVALVSAMVESELTSPMSDAYLALAQPTMAHHLQSLIFHEGYHCGQLSAWRMRHGFAAVRWTMGPR